MGSKEYLIGPTIAVFLFPALGGFLFGYDIGATSFVVEQITGDKSGVKWGGLLDDNKSLTGAVTSASVFGALLASIVVFKLSEYIGRRAEMMVGSIFYGVGAFIEALSSQPNASANVGISILILGRVVYGFGIGFCMHGAPAYIGEMSPPAIRGLLISLKEAAIVVGILFGYLVGYILSSKDGGWAYTFGISAVVAVVIFFGCFTLHESARWLYLKGRKEEALASLNWVLPAEVARATYADLEIQENHSTDKNSIQIHRNEVSIDDILNESNKPAPVTVWDKKFRPALIAGVGLVFLQQVTGQPSVLYYAATIFKEAGLADVAIVGMAAFKLIMTLFTVFTVDKYGRKFLLYIGISLMLLSLIALSIAFKFTPSESDDDGDDDGSKKLSATQIVILIALFTYIGGYQIGFGPIAWLLISEVFPLEVRGQAVSLAVQTNFFWNVVTNYVFPLETAALGASYTFMIFAFIDAYALYHVYMFVPETKGLTLEQIEVILGSRDKNFKDYENSSSDVKKRLLSNDEE